MKFSKPYTNCIPEMIKFCLSETKLDFENMKLYKQITPMRYENQEILITKNIMNRLMNDKTYFFTENYFKINFIEFNNLKNYNPIKINIECLFDKQTPLGKIETEKIKYVDNSRMYEEKKERFSIKSFFKGLFPAKKVKTKPLNIPLTEVIDKNFDNFNNLKHDSLTNSFYNRPSFSKEKEKEKEEDNNINRINSNVSDNGYDEYEIEEMEDKEKHLRMVINYFS